jgi:hypothetical protein
MFLVVQFPFADARHLLRVDTGQLTLPTWPIPEPHRQFIRSVGQVLERRRGGLEPWVGEGIFCDASRALRFGAPQNFQPPQLTGGEGRFVCAFRRFFSDGRAVARIEAGFHCRFTRSVQRPLRPVDLVTLVRGLASLPVTVHWLRPQKEVPLRKAGSFLATYLVECTTKRTAPPVSTERWWLSPGEPLYLLEYRVDEVLDLPRRRQVQSPTLSQYSIDLSHTSVKTNGNREIAVWLVGLRPETDVPALRRLRIHLFRLHAERESVKQLARLMIQGRIPATSDDSQAYLRDTFDLLKAPRKFGIDQPEILEAAYEFEDLLSPGERSTLLSLLQQARRYVKELVEVGTQKPQPTRRVIETGIVT